MLRLLILALCALPLVASPLVVAAQETPPPRGWMRIGPLPPGEVLNLRAAPSGEAEVVARLTDDALVVSSGERAVSSVAWLRVGQGELHGWAAERFLSPAEIRTIDGSTLPVAGACGGVEPMWSLEWTALEMSFVRIDAAPAARPVTRVVRAEGRPFALLEAGADPADRWLFRYEDEQCFETPLDAPVWGRGTLILTEGGVTRWLTGCCRPSAGAVEPP